MSTTQTTTTAQEAVPTIILKDATILSVGQFEKGKSTVKVSIKNPVEGEAAIKTYASARTEADLDFIEALEDANIAGETYSVTLNESSFPDSETNETITLIFVNPYSPSVEDLTKEQLLEMRKARRAEFKAGLKKASSTAVQEAIAKANAELETSEDKSAE